MLYLGGRECWVEAPQVLRLRELGRGEEGLGVRGLLLGEGCEEGREQEGCGGASCRGGAVGRRSPGAADPCLGPGENARRPEALPVELEARGAAGAG